jgi:hypothetical protein
MLPRPPLTRNQVELMQIDTVSSSEMPGFAVWQLREELAHSHPDIGLERRDIHKPGLFAGSGLYGGRRQIDRGSLIRRADCGFEGAALQ